MDSETHSPEAARARGNPVIFLVIFALLAAFILWSVFGGFRKKTPDTAQFDVLSAPEITLKPVPPEPGTSWYAVEVPPMPSATEQIVAHGKELFAKACAGCHGGNGAGDGPVGQRIDFANLPADLTRPVFTIKIRTTPERHPPAPEDLFRTITRGFPDTPMWSFRNLPADDRWALVHYIRTLSPKYSEQPLEKVELPPKPEDTEALRQRGAAFYNRTCINCHGQNGMGAPGAQGNPQTLRPYPGLAFARKGGKVTMSGDSDEDIARTLLTGLGNLSQMRNIKPQIYLDQDPAKQADYDKLFWGVVFHVRQLMRDQTAK
jgi:mono/diheme cytochrome c family protein